MQGHCVYLRPQGTAGQVTEAGGHADEAESLGSPLYGVSLVGSPHAGQRVILRVTEGHSGSRADHRKVTHLEASAPRKISMRVRECACGGRVYVKSR